MSRRTDITSTGHKIRVGAYTLCLDVKMHIDEVQAGLKPVPTVDIATIERIKVTQIFDRVKRKDIDKIYQHPFFHE
jgi:hypothetical protein